MTYPLLSCAWNDYSSSGAYVEGLTSIVVSDWGEMSQLLTYGGGARTVAATNANDWSSRSHAVFTLIFRQVLRGRNKVDDPSLKLQIRSNQSGGGVVHLLLPLVI